MTEKIAKVVVDVPASNINRFFDYLIPDKLLGAIEIGMRVIVPFGNRTIMGYVLETVNETTFDETKLKQIKTTLDVQPVLTKELIDLGQWLAESTLSYFISSFQAMLPQALKASYDKSLHRLHPPINQRLADLFDGRDYIGFDELNDDFPLRIVNDEIGKGNVEWDYHVSTNESFKYVTMVEVIGTEAKFDLYLADLTKQSKKQFELVQYFLDDHATRPLKKVLKDNKTTRNTLNKLIDQQLIRLVKQQVNRDPYQGETEKTTPLTLAPQQQKALDAIVRKMNQHEAKTFLLHGVTGSGKTEVYLQAIDLAIRQDKEAIVLVPEISLTPMMVERFKRRFGDAVAVLHSALSKGERFDEWRKIQKKQVSVAVGARSAIFAPFENLGMIIIDEEHESTYKQEDHPRYHVRDVAKHRADYHKCPVVLGTATPTLETYARAKKGVYQLIEMPERINQSLMPKVTIQDMREELHQGNRTMFSRQLKEAIERRLEKREQVVLFLNRRGYSTFVMCRDCGHTVECPSCDISLTYHQRDHRLKCHYCNYSEPMPNVCPNCQSESIRFFGTGTEKVEEALNETFPEARIIRMDVDTTRKKGAHERLLKQFGNKQADILLGTQMIAKGLDFPDVTLVGVLAADGLLNLPDFRAAEKTFQLLTQVSGRAGRHELTGEVIVQTYTPEHYSVLFAKDYDYHGFFKQEMALRKAYQYPPYYFLTLITVTHENRLKAEEVTRVIQKLLVKHLTKEAVILGPTPSPIERIKGRYRFQCMVKYKDEPDLMSVLRKILQHYEAESRKEQLMIHIDLNPQQLM
ncbi:replication restart DNA helicase PriA [Halolactibacillus halophilus]|uniref:Replication restart protein PriA n=1 Tax=Halolactibacillus halophilus TaxID=306540 RepID=A0A1I5LR03_9BACI|nr:primosomal protein N' [Halolactibacillus halophilus]GEM00722.1 primosomal protein N' [Halolactibacillus halophilus]SFO99191.1 replication restart DNA helicase PriA [Halolactibacillus halophilus]